MSRPDSAATALLSQCVLCVPCHAARAEIRESGLLPRLWKPLSQPLEDQHMRPAWGSCEWTLLYLVVSLGFLPVDQHIDGNKGQGRSLAVDLFLMNFPAGHVLFF